MGATGIDIVLSAAARKLFGFAVECRNQQNVNIWKAWEDAKRHGVKESLSPLAIIHRNHSDVLVVLDLPTFLAILKTDGEPEK